MARRPAGSGSATPQLRPGGSVCRAITQRMDAIHHWLASFWNRLDLVPTAQAEVKIIHFVFDAGGPFEPMEFKAEIDNPKLAGFDGFRFEGFGVVIVWLVPGG